ncbi:MAG: hypothetical protein Q8R43_00660, partial [Alphaproteobacteria bacterium]|nr:hypothetical protein [Alphaproteobacteria bacterium]
AKKTAAADTAETLKEKATTYAEAKEAKSITTDIQHYRLAYFLMIKLKPWLDDNYKNDPDEVDTLLKNHIPTYYPEWTDQKILIKGLKVKLDNAAKPNAEEPKIKFSTAQTKIPEGTIVYSYIDDKGTEVDDSKYKITLSADGSDATISGLTDYGLYYVEVDGVKQYFAVNSTKENQFIYSPDGIVKFQTEINKGLKIAAEENKDFHPKLSLFRNGNVLDKNTFKVRLKGETTWKKLDDFETNDFLLSNNDLEFSGLNAGTYIFEADASDEVVVTPLNSDGEGKTTGGVAGSIVKDNSSFEVLESIVKFTATAANKTYDGNTTATITSWLAEASNGTKFGSSETTGFASAILLTGTFRDAEEGTNKSVDGTVSFKLGADTKAYKENYMNLPTFTTTASITSVTTTPVAPVVIPTITYGGLEQRTIIPTYNGVSQDPIPVIAAKGVTKNIIAGTYNVSIPTVDNPNATGKIVVDANGNFFVSLRDLTFNSGESVTITISSGDYNGKSFTFNAPVIAPVFTNATNGTGSVEFTVGAAFNGITPSFVAGGDVTGYTGGTSISGGKVTRAYTTSQLGSITTGQKINIMGTNFTFTGTATSTINDANFTVVNGVSNVGFIDVTIQDKGRIFAEGTEVTNIEVFDMSDNSLALKNSTDTANFDNQHVFVFTLGEGITLDEGTKVSFKISGSPYEVVYTEAVIQ